MSLIGPLVNPNHLEERFGRVRESKAFFRHPRLIAFFVVTVLAAGAAAIIRFHIGF